ncbi:hypothetical protein [Pontibacter ramchanderi]|uniref:Uncharacterized protein n=1 Tax=Pontibacter ramchanderi TaxID=1179743 RepID=A0A2N3U7Q8_9BACT|nr:hypothetical protein [Pontibacter ramchanderi]PKV62776.1 hypothetical protein BD749_3663 [Pontibacter ramchanderi]
MIKALHIILLILLFAFATNAQDKKGKGIELNKKEIEQYSYDTLLSQGYHLSYRVYLDSATDEGLQSLTLVKGKRDIKQLSETSYPMLHKNLGYIGADFGDTFLFVQSFGSGNPHEIQLIDKKTGKELMNGVWVDVNQPEKVILYITNIYEENEDLKLLDLKNKKEIVVKDFSDSNCVKEQIGGLRNCVEIDSVTSKEIILKIESEGERITKKYKR